MADYTPVATQSKPPQPMSLAEMMNLANSTQAYQQAQQLNPLQIQALQQNVEQARQMNPELLQQAKQTSRIGQIALGVDEQKDIERRNMQTFFADPNNFQTNGRIDLDKINTSVPKIAPLTGSEYINKYTTLGQAQTQAVSAKQNLTQDQRSMVAQRYATLGRLGIQDKNVYLNEMDLLKQENPDNPDLHRLIDAHKTVWNNSMESGPDLPKKAIAGANALMTLEQQQSQFGSKAAVDAQGRVITTTLDIAGGKPNVEVSIPQGLQSQQGGTTTGAAGSEVAPGVRLPFPVRSPDKPYQTMPTEEKDQTAGQAYRNNLVSAQTNLAQGRRNVDEVISQANKLANDLTSVEKGGGYGQKIGQQIRMFVSSADYETLAKDLAQMHITNSLAMGAVGNTVAGLDMAKVANGTIKVPPEVLIKIAGRVQADQRNLDMQANGAQQFFQKFGDNNMKAYQQAWNANARDTKIFEAMNILENETDPNKLQGKFKELFPSEKKRKTILKQYRNLKSMAATGLPAEPLTSEDF